jgi:DNA-binding transcriptional MerR regulator
MQIRDIVRASGVPAKTIRYYESIGLLPPAARAANNYRRYQAADVERLRFIASARSLGFSLSDIAEVLTARDQGTAPCSRVLGVLDERLSQLDRHIADLLALREDLRRIRAEGALLRRDDVAGEECVCYLVRAYGQRGRSRLTARKFPMASSGNLTDQPAACCPPPAASAVQQRQACPACGRPGKAVGLATVRAQLAINLRSVTGEAYCFCATAGCPVVYFTPDGSQQFTTDQLREAVFQKAPTDPAALVCYCFQHSLGAIQEADASTQAQIFADITAGVQAGQCACDMRNPQGACCLGNVRRVIQGASLEVSSL